MPGSSENFRETPTKSSTIFLKSMKVKKEKRDHPRAEDTEEMRN